MNIHSFLLFFIYLMTYSLLFFFQLWENTSSSWLSVCLSGWLTDWLTDWLTNWLTDWLTDWLSDSLTVWLTDWSTDRLTDWLTDSWEFIPLSYFTHLDKPQILYGIRTVYLLNRSNMTCILSPCILYRLLFCICLFKYHF